MRRRLRNTSAVDEPSLLMRGCVPMASLIQTLAVAEYLNFRHAANALGVAQSSVSARVKALEEDLGILLFERHARGVRLTEAGRHFVERIAIGVDQLDHAVKTAAIAALVLLVVLQWLHRVRRLVLLVVQPAWHPVRLVSLAQLSVISVVARQGEQLCMIAASHLHHICLIAASSQCALRIGAKV